VSDNTPQNPGDTPGGYAPPPQQPGYAAPQPPAYGAPPAYGSAPQYPGQAPYGAAAPYPYAPQQKTNTLAIVSLVASLVGIVWILPFIGSLVGVITGHMSLNQLKTSGEKGRGLALAGTIVGWVGLAFTIIIGIVIILAIVYAAQSSSEFTT
jgi:hypothetical protein